MDRDRRVRRGENPVPLTDDGGIGGTQGTDRARTAQTQILDTQGQQVPLLRPPTRVYSSVRDVSDLLQGSRQPGTHTRRDEVELVVPWV